MNYMKVKILLILCVALGLSCGNNRISTSQTAQSNAANAANSNIIAKATPAATASPNAQLDVPYVPTHQMIVDEMLKMAEVKASDLLYDLGSGDGRIPITAAKRFGTRGVGVDLDPQRIKEANENAQKAGVTDRVTFIQGDLFKTDFKEATVLTLYLLPDVNLKLKPEILKMKPGTRVVSHNYDMGDWTPEKSKTIVTPDGVDHYVYFWRVPEQKK